MDSIYIKWTPDWTKATQKSINDSLKYVYIPLSKKSNSLKPNYQVCTYYLNCEWINNFPEYCSDDDYYGENGTQVTDYEDYDHFYVPPIGNYTSPSTGAPCQPDWTFGGSYITSECQEYPDPPPGDPEDPNDPGGSNNTNDELIVDVTSRPCVDSIIAAITPLADIRSKLASEFSSTVDYNNVASIFSKAVNSTSFNVTIKESVISDVTDPNTDNTVQTDAITNAVRGKIYINLNTNYLNSGTDLSIARTILHEMIHSYFDWGLAQPMDPNYTDFQNANKLLFDKSGNELTDAFGDAQHAQMANNYVDGLAALLTDYATNRGISSPNSSQSIESYCHDLAWAGLQGTKAYNYIPSGDKARIANNIKNEATRTTNSSLIKGC